MKKNDDYTIEKNIPIPEPEFKHHGRWHKIALHMEIGDSVLVNGRLEAMNMRNAIARMGYKCVTRGNDKPQTRVWKLAK